MSSGWYFGEYSRYSLGKFNLPLTAHNELRLVMVRALCGKVREFGSETRRYGVVACACVPLAVQSKKDPCSPLLSRFVLSWYCTCHGSAMDLRPGEHAVTDCGFDSGRAGPHRALCAGPGEPDDSYVIALYSERQFYPEFIVNFIRIADDSLLG